MQNSTKSKYLNITQSQNIYPLESEAYKNASQPESTTKSLPMIGIL